MNKMPTFCANKLARVANNLFDFFMPHRNFYELFSITNFANYLITFSNILKYLLLRSFSQISLIFKIFALRCRFFPF